MARVTANAQGNAPTGTKVGDIVSTKGGDYKVVEKGTPGANYNPTNGLYSVKVTGSGSSGSSGSSSGGSSKPSSSGGSSGGGSTGTYLDEDGNKKQGLYTSDLDRYNTIQQMQALGSAWHQTDDADKRDKLADQSLVLGSSIGATRDKDGVWWYDGQKLFETQYQPEEVPNYYENYEKKLADYQANQQDLIHQQYKAALEAAKLSLNGQKTQVNQQYDDLARQLYIQRRQQELALPQQMAAMGYTGGITESSALGLQTSYADALRQGETERINTIASLEQAITQAELEGNQQLAAQLASLAQSTMGLYSDALAQIQNQAATKQQFKYQQVLDSIANRQWNQQFVYDQEQDKLDRETNSKNQLLSSQESARSSAYTKLQMGIVPTDEELALLGLSRTEATQVAQIYRNSMMGLY